MAQGHRHRGPGREGGRGEGEAAGKTVEIVVYPDAPHGFHADYRPSYRQATPKTAGSACLIGSSATASSQERNVDRLGVRLVGQGVPGLERREGCFTGWDHLADLKPRIVATSVTRVRAVPGADDGHRLRAGLADRASDRGLFRGVKRQRAARPLRARRPRRRSSCRRG